jgi:hypothetical protein
MAIPVLSNLDLSLNQILNLVVQNLSSDPGSPVAGQFWYNTTTNVLKYYDGTATRIIGKLTNSLSDFAAPTSDLPIGSHKLTGVADPTSASDAATKGYVDSAALGLDVHASVRAASTANVVVASGLVNGVAIDGITIATGDRILLKNQTAPAENGVYVTAASGAAARAADLNSSANYLSGIFVFVEQGTANAAAGFIVTTQGSITVGTTSVTWTQMSGATSYTAGSGLLLTGTVFSLKVDGTTVYVDGSGNTAVKSSATANQTLLSNGSSTTPTWGALPIGNANAVSGQLAIANGGTAGSTAATARANLGATTKFSGSIGDGSSTTIDVAHGLGTTDVIVQVHDGTTPFEIVQVEAKVKDSNTVTVIFATAPATNRYRVAVIG